MTFYLKYRPQKINDLDLKEVRESLKKIVKSKKISHAFLFSGPKGSGKTSAARIIAKVVNCERGKGNDPPAGGEPCNKCKQCVSITQGSNIDVIELDAASHRGIDDVRTLRDAVKLASASAKKKVYIIDESHMLTTEASNALLKTLEEPPEHVMFILATTNPEKLIETIRSRAVNVVFKKATTDEIVRSLTSVVKGEKLKAEKGVLEMIAKASDGSFRDAVKILEQLISENKKLNTGEIEEYLFQKKLFDAESFLELISEKEIKKALSVIESAVGKGVNVKNMMTSVIGRLREALLYRIGMEGEDLDYFDKNELILLIKLFSKADSEVPSSIIEQLPMEIAVVEWCEGEKKSSINLPAGKAGSKSKRDSLRDKEEVVGTLKKKELTKGNPGNPGLKAQELTDEVWMRILSQIKPKNSSTEALLRATRPVNFDGKILELGVFYRFHKEQLESKPHRTLLEDVASEILGNGVRVVCTLTEHLRSNRKQRSNVSVTTETESEPLGATLTESEDEDIIKVAKDIFGS